MIITQGFTDGTLITRGYTSGAFRSLREVLRFTITITKQIEMVSVIERS